MPSLAKLSILYLRCQIAPLGAETRRSATFNSLFEMLILEALLNARNIEQVLSILYLRCQSRNGAGAEAAAGGFFQFSI